MKYVKMLGLLAVAAAAMTAFAATASATTVTSSAGTTPTIEASAGATTFDGVLDVTCEASSLSGGASSHGSGVTVIIPVSYWSITKCGNDWVIMKKTGTLQIHAKWGGNSSVTWSGGEFTVVADTIFGDIHCIFTTNATEIGTLTAGTHAKLDIDSALIPRTGGTGGGLCGSSAEWTGSYTVNSPTNISVDS